MTTDVFASKSGHQGAGFRLPQWSLACPQCPGLRAAAKAGVGTWVTDGPLCCPNPLFPWVSSLQFSVAFSDWGGATSPHLPVISHRYNTHVEKAQGFILAHGSGGLIQGQLALVLWAWGLRLST